MKILLYSLGLALVLASGASQVPANSEPGVEFDWQPPSFEAVTAGGNDFRFPDDLQGPMIVLFWATWCPYCKALMPHIQSVLDEYGHGVRVLAINFREDDDPAEFIETYGYEFLLLPNADEVASSWGVKATPGLFLVDRNGLATFSLRAIPDEAFSGERYEDYEELKHYQKAARKAPYWAARLREALDDLLEKKN
jgi:thiol-disulfide isomerase/thioredoxin